MNTETIGLHPANVRHLLSGDSSVDAGVEAAAQALQFASEATEKINELATTLKGDRDLSPSGRIRKFREQESKLRECAMAKLDAARTLIESKIRKSEHDASALPNSESEEGLRRESNLVAAIRGMTPEQRSKLRDTDNLGDDELAGAILRSHHVAVGMSRSEWDAYRLSWQRQKFPGHFEKLERLTRALGYLERAEPIINAYGEKKVKSLAGGSS